MRDHNRRLQNKFNSNNKFVCRLCRKKHPLRICRRFLNMNTSERTNVVVKYGYCRNCLAHSHSQGSCFTKTGCRYCKKDHHSLLHIHPRLTHSSKGAQCSSSSIKPSQGHTSISTSERHRHEPTTLKIESASLYSILKQNTITLLPTALVKINGKNGKYSARCLLDSGSKLNYISNDLVEKLKLTTLELDGEIICPTTLHSCVDSKFTVQTTMRVNNRISTRTPNNTVPETIQAQFTNMLLADKYFHKPSSIDIILGVDMYSRIMRDGPFQRPGLPTAQNTALGIIIFGSISN